MTQLSNQPPYISDRLEVARVNLMARRRTNTINEVQGDIAIALTLLKELYNIDIVKAHANQDQDGVEYTLTMTLRGKA